MSFKSDFLRMTHHCFTYIFPLVLCFYCGSQILGEIQITPVCRAHNPLLGGAVQAIFTLPEGLQM